MPEKRLCYLITISQKHLLPAQMLLRTLRETTGAPIVAVGNLDADGRRVITPYGVSYVDENDIDLGGRLPHITWQEKTRNLGWYKQQFICLSIDRFMDADDVVVLDSEVFVFKNWDESHFYEADGRPRCFYWISSQRKFDWDYQMYRGAAQLLAPLSECTGIISYANSDEVRRYISGVVLFSVANIAELWRRLEQETDLEGNLDTLFNHSPDVSFSEYQLYGFAAEYGLFGRTVPVALHPNLLGWYDTHDDPVFNEFKTSAMWSMCQRYEQYPDAPSYWNYMQQMAGELGQELPDAKYP